MTQQAFSFGDYLSATASWPNKMPTNASAPQPLVIWLHPYSYNTGYSPQYGQADVRGALIGAGGGGGGGGCAVVMAFDQVGFGIRVTQVRRDTPNYRVLARSHTTTTKQGMQQGLDLYNIRELLKPEALLYGASYPLYHTAHSLRTYSRSHSQSPYQQPQAVCVCV